MHIKYSKPAGDIQVEEVELINLENELIEGQRKACSVLAQSAERKHCNLCHSSFESTQGEHFLHRNIKFVKCPHCDFIQSFNNPSEEFHQCVKSILGFNKIYPELKDKDFISRRDRVYKPKLEWIKENFPGSLKNKKWFEIGTGAGYFLSALQQDGIEIFSGIDQEKKLVDMANQKLGGNFVLYNQGCASKILQTTDAQVYVAFFVLEHLEDLKEFFRELSSKPKGTIFIFAVPLFGLATLLENSLLDHAARNLDGMTHTQIFTDRSINYGLKEAGYKIISQWVFGQDILDLRRYLLTKLTGKYPARMMEEITQKIDSLVDPMQQAADTTFFADARHIIAIKESY